MLDTSTVRALPVGSAAAGTSVWAWSGRWAAVRWPSLALAVLAVPLAVVCTRSALDWIDRPFPGFFVTPNATVPAVGLFDWNGARAGLPYRARIRSIDGRPVASGEDVYAAVADLPPGTTVEYGVEHRDRRFFVRVPTTTFGLFDYWLTVGLFVAYGIVVLFAGIAVSLVRPFHAAAPAFLAQTASTGLYALTAPLLYDARRWWLAPLHFAAQGIFPAALIHLTSTFPVPRRVIPRWSVGAAYALGILVALWLVAGQAADPPRLLPVYVAYGYAAAATIACGVILAWTTRRSRDQQLQRQLHAVLPAIGLGLAVAAYGFVETIRRGGGFPMNLIAISALFSYVGIGWAIARHDLFDIDHVLRRTLVYGALTVGVTAAYGAAVAFATLLDPQLVAGNATLFHVAFVVLVAGLFEPARARVQRAVDRVFWRERIEYRVIVQDVSAALATLRDLDEILDRLGRTLCLGLTLRAFLAILWQGTETRVWVWRDEKDAMEEIPGQRFDDLRRTLARGPDGPWEVPGLPGDLDPVLFVPLTVAGQLIGAFGLGRRRSGRGFGPEDAELLGTLAAQSGIALENARSYRALQTVADELEEKVRQRTAELQASNHELAAAYRELKLAQAQLVQSEKMASLGLLVSGVAHEINNPVSFIVGNVEPLRETMADLAARAAAVGDSGFEETIARVRRAFEVIARGAERTAGIVNDLRTFSRLGEAQPRPVDVHDGIEVSLRLLRPRWADRITIHRAYGALPPVDAVPGQLNQVLMNLLTNACDAIPERGNVWIDTAVLGSDVVVTVRDDGVGIPAADLDRIFDPFFTTKPQGKGTGLGLAISHGIVMQHGGSIAVASAPGQGTTFTLRLARRACPPAAASTS